MTEPIENQVIVDLSRKVMQDIAPKEKRVFKTISEAYFKNPEKTLKEEGGQDELLGFGFGEVALILTPFILEIVRGAFKDLLQDSLKNSLKDSLKKIPGANSSRSQQTQDVNLILVSLKNELTEKRLKQVYIFSCERAIQLGIDEDKAKLMAESIVNHLKI